MSAYYNEYDKKMAAWLRELIKAKLIPDGEVDERSIEDVRPRDLRGFVQCHFFAGLGGWSEALRLADWPDDRSVWTGSCPCQPFSAAGQGNGTSDERHLWPAWFHLISECRPSTVFGEQVDAAVKHGWLDLVQSDLERIGYAFAPAVIPAAGIGAPHGRHRIWFVADTQSEQSYRSNAARNGRTESTDGSTDGELEHSNSTREHERPSSGEQSLCDINSEVAGTMVDAESQQAWVSRFAREQRRTGGFWSDADWIPCTDGKWRPIEPGTFPLAHGVPNRMELLRGYGNAIVPEVAAQFIKAFDEITY